jgi:hypothetical protein
MPGVMLKLRILNLLILLHVLRNLLIEDLLWKLQLLLPLRFLLYSDEFKTVTYEKKTTIVGPAIDTVV